MSNQYRPKDLTGKPVNPGDWVVYHEMVRNNQTRLGLVLHKFSHERYLVFRSFIRGYWESNWSFDTTNLNNSFVIDKPLEAEKAFKALAAQLNLKKLSKTLEQLTPEQLASIQSNWGIYV